MKWPAVVLGLLALQLTSGPARSYPLDGGRYTGIARLQGEATARTVADGARLPLDQVGPRLLARGEFVLPPGDPGFQQEIVQLLGNDSDRYALAVLDLTDLDQPRYAEHRGEATYNPGSIGKLLIALGVFQVLADSYPDDIPAREKVLRQSSVTADAFIRSDHHRVPIWNTASTQLDYRPLRIGDRASLWTYLDWMLSASSNAAASMVLRELLLLKRFGRGYPASAAEEARFWRETSKRELSALLASALHEPVPRNGLDPEQLRQGGFFTWKGKQLVPGTTSHASPRMLLNFLLLLEQGKLVDGFSSRELKRLIYMTERRIRYASAPALKDAAVYFKSGSLYRCEPEPGFTCGKYQGNVDNLLNSVAIVEAPAGERRYFYLVVVMSNVLKQNSAVAHQTLATRLQRLIEASHRFDR